MMILDITIHILLINRKEPYDVISIITRKGISYFWPVCVKESKWYGAKRSQTKIPDPQCGIRLRMAAGKDPVNYSTHFNNGYDSDDDEED